MDESKFLKILSALAQTTRLACFQRLAACAPDGAQAGDLARYLGVPQNTLSAHLSILAQAGLVQSERRSRAIIYRAQTHVIGDLALFLLKDCCGGRPEACATQAQILALDIARRQSASDNNAYEKRGGKDVVV